MEISAEPLRPLPLADDLTADYWASIRAHRLSIQHCSNCGRYNHVPSLICPACGSDDLAFKAVTGRGTLYSWTILHDAPAPGFRDRLPVIIGIVELEEQPRLMLVTNLVEFAPDQLRLGREVEVVFEDITEDSTLPQFRPTGAQ